MCENCWVNDRLVEGRRNWDVDVDWVDERGGKVSRDEEEVSSESFGGERSKRASGVKVTIKLDVQ
jgi:hypothetical protein